MKAPQIIVIVLYALSLGVHLAKHGEPKDGEYNFGASFITVAIIFGCLWWGGFFA